MAIPSRIIAIDGLEATVESFGAMRRVSLMLLDEPVGLGDLVLVQAGGFASRKVDPEEGEAALEYLAQVLELAGGAGEPE